MLFKWCALLLLLGPVACKPPDTSSRGFDSRQFLDIRDDGVRLGPFALDNKGVYRVRALQDVAVPDGTKPPFDLTLLDLGTGSETLVAPGVLSLQKLPVKRVPPASMSMAPTADGRTLAFVHFGSDADVPVALVPNLLPPVILTFLDEATGAAFDIDAVDAQRVQLGATRADPIMLGRLGPDRESSLWFGAPDSLMPVPPGINQVIGLDRAGIVGLVSTPNSDTQQLTRFTFDGSAPVTLVPGVLGDYVLVAGGDTAAPPPLPPVLPGGGVVARLSCSSQAAASDGPPTPCLLFYERVRPGPEKTVLAFVRPSDEAGEMELPGPILGHIGEIAQVAPDGRDLFWPAISSPKQTRVFNWHVGDDHAASCVVPIGPAAATFGIRDWRAGTGQFAVVAQPASQSDVAPAAWTAIAGKAGTECHVIATGTNLIRQLFYSPDGSRLAFLEITPRGAWKVYVADADAPAPEVVAEGMFSASIDFHDAQHLLLLRATIDGYSLSSLDVSTIPVVSHPIADGVVLDARASWTWLNAHTLLLADTTSPEDGSFSLHVVDIDTGAQRLVSRGVVDFAVSWTKRPADATELIVAYVVRGRTPSAQDGLWLAHLDLADFPL